MLRSQLFRYSNSHIEIQFKLEIFVTYNKNYFTYSCIDYFFNQKFIYKRWNNIYVVLVIKLFN